MHSAPHRNRSDFQLRHFIAGSCHTPDAAWNILYEQKLDMQIKLASTRAQFIRREVKRRGLDQRAATIQTEDDRLLLEADLIEFQSGEGLIELAIAGAEKELATIDDLMAELEPLRKYAHLPLLEATEAAQREEWREEFKHRIENYAASSGCVPHDQLEAMRKHPDFDSHILPHLKGVMLRLEAAKSASGALDVLASPNHLLTHHGDGDVGT